MFNTATQKLRTLRAAKLVGGLSVAAIIVASGIIAWTAYSNDSRRNVPLVFSENSMLLELWSDYKENNIEKGSYRTLDRQQDNITTSEGQSYTMLRAVWMDDQDMFDKSWQWTKDNLQRDDKLMSWKFGILPSGEYGIQQSVGGQNTATDGDSDIALALLMAYVRWNNTGYYYDATPIIGSIWDKEVVTIQDKPVLVANDLERLNTERVIVNPSYLTPYAYKVFAEVDPSHDWRGLVDNSYEILKKVGDLPLDKASSSGLPPNWVTINRRTGEIGPAVTPDLTTHHGYDAVRTSWRLALDYKWFQDERAREVLATYEHLNRQWQENGRIHAVYGHDGEVIENYETPATYGATIGYFQVIHPDTARTIYQQKLQSLYNPDEQKWNKPMAYYDDNWAWFGMALMEDKLPNLTEIR